MHRVKKLIDALTVVLGEVTVDGNKVIKNIKAATEIDVAFLRKVPDTQVVSIGQHDFDGENPQCGTQEVLLDIWTKDVTQNAGARQLTEEEQLSSIADAVLQQVGHNSSGPFGAATTLIRTEVLEKDSPDERIFTFRIRLAFEVLWG